MTRIALPEHDAVLALYEEARFLDAHRLTQHLWSMPHVVQELDVRRLLLGARLAVRLGSRRLANVLFGTARRRDPADPGVRYYCRMRGATDGLYGVIREFEKDPELPTSDRDLLASWFASVAGQYAMLRDFDAAHHWLQRAEEQGSGRGWVAACAAEVLLAEDRPEDALQQAEAAWQRQPGMPYSAGALCRALARQNRRDEAVARLRGWVVAGGQSGEVLLTLLTQMILHLERSPEHGREAAALAIFELADRFAGLAPLADRHAHRSLKLRLLDAARLVGDHARYADLARAVDVPFHNATARNLAANPQGKRMVLPHRPVRQDHNTCLPASVCTVLSAVGVEADQREIARELTYDGTAAWRMDDYARKQGLRVRRFIADLPSIKALLNEGVPCLISFDFLNNAHACAVVGADFALGTLLIHDPSFDSLGEQLLEHLGKGESPLGPRCAVMYPLALAARLDALPLNGEREADVHSNFQQVVEREDAPGALAFLKEAALPASPVSEYLQARALGINGRAQEALATYQRLLQQWPDCVALQRSLIAATDEQGDTALMRRTLQGILARTPLPGVSGGEEYIYPAPHLYARYANLLRASATGMQEARHALRTALRRGPLEAEAYYACGELCWQEGRYADAALPYRLASTLHAENDHYARAYADVLHRLGRHREAIQSLERRARRFAAKLDAAGPYRTLVSALEDYGFPTDALQSLREGLKARPADGELAAYAAMMFSRYALQQEATAALAAAACHAPPAAYHHAAGTVARTAGNMAGALEHATRRVESAPTSMAARAWLLHLTEQMQGPDGAQKLATQWMAEHPGHEGYEEFVLDRLDRTTGRARRVEILQARLKRNEHDAWAWRELGFTLLAGAESASATRRLEEARELENVIRHCERTSPESSFTFMLRADWMVLHSRVKEALGLCARALELEPAYNYALERLFDLANLLAGEFPQQAADIADSALSREPGHWTQAPRVADRLAGLVGVEEARRRVARWVRRDRRDPWPVLAWAKMLLRHGQGVQDARRVLRRLRRSVERFPLHEQLRYALAEAYSLLQRPEEEQATLRGILATAPGETLARVLLSECLEALGRVGEAVQELTRATELNSLDFRVWNALVGLHERSRNLPAALDASRAACEHLPDSMNLWERRIQLLERSGRGAEALKVAQEVAGRYPGGAYAQLLLARALRLTLTHARQGEIAAQYEKAISLNAQLFDAVDEYAEFLCLHARFEDARRLVERHVRVAEAAWPLQARLAEILRAERRNGEALQAAADLVRKRPDYRYGWRLLFDWAAEDRELALARQLLPLVPPTLEQNADFCAERLDFLEAAKAPPEETERGWVRLVENFPQDPGINQRRCDSLIQAGRFAEAEQLASLYLQHSAGFAPMLACLVAVYCGTRRPELALQVADRLWFDSKELSMADCALALDALERSSRGKTNLVHLANQLLAGRLPRVQAVRAVGFRGARDKHPHELSAFAQALAPRALEYGSWEPFAAVLDGLIDAGNAGWVVSFRDHHRQVCHEDPQLWMVVGRALGNVNRHKEAAEWLAGWRNRAGTEMWGITNLLTSLLSEGRYDACERNAIAALRELEHDHSADTTLQHLVYAAVCAGDTARAMAHLAEHRDILKRVEKKGDSLILLELFERLSVTHAAADVLELDRRFRAVAAKGNAFTPAPFLKAWRQGVLARLPWFRRLLYRIAR
ncbi:MAG: tetratricopeptide repeat protein [Planctomycetes bacterium]|nr:tetratricopeptide repeat protein [Planctomycetota bacterium]